LTWTPAGTTDSRDLYGSSYANRVLTSTSQRISSPTIFLKRVEGAIVISNDSDLALPLSIARTLVPVGTVDPANNTLAGALKGDRNEGPGQHWWRKLRDQDYYGNQLPNPVGNYYKPTDW
jgi:hypothetical protein